MTVRATMTDLIALVRQMIADPAGPSQIFGDQQIQDRLDASRDDIRYESLALAPSIVNLLSTNNQATTIYADYYSAFQWWEADVVLQGYLGGRAWVVLSPLASDLIVGRWQFEVDVWTSGTAPGQLPPVFATGKVYDPNAAAADLLEFRAAQVALDFDFSSDGQSFKRSQKRAALLELAAQYRRSARMRRAKLVRSDITTQTSPLWHTTRTLEDR